MDRLCTKCARFQLQAGSQAGRRAYTSVRSFTSTCITREDENPSNGQSTSVPIRRGGQPPSQQPLRRPAAGPVGQSSVPRVLRNTGAPRPGQLLRRSSDGSSSADGQRLPPLRQRPSGPGMLRRTGPPSGPGLLRRTAGPNRPGFGARGPSGPQQGKKGAPRRRGERRDDKDDDGSAFDDQAIDEYVEKYIDPPETPTKHLPYTPKNLTLADLKPDWPDTPMSSAGLSESILMKIQWLAQRLPHGYQSPRALAEHFLKGELTRFESEAEKAEVLKVAAELKDELAAVEPRKRDAPLPIASDAGFQDLIGEKAFLVDGTVKGAFGELEKQKHPFMNNVLNGLRNNGTYGDVQTAKFMDAVNRLIPQRRVAGKVEKTA